MNEIQKFILENVEHHPTDIVRLAIKTFDVSRTAVFFHITKLKELGLIGQEGSRNKSRYFLIKKKKVADKQTTSEKRFSYKVGEKGEDTIWKTDIKPALGQMKTNVEDILQYCFTEMYNNVIDHSESQDAYVNVNDLGDKFEIFIHDFGIGVFRKISRFFGIGDMREAVVRLHQGKVTTDETKHTGQGIFFSSRAVDEFTIFANGFNYYKNNSHDDDWYFESQEPEEKSEGTSVGLVISKDSNRILKDVFDAYTNPETFSFDKSHIRIELGSFEEDKFISRSQAKRLLTGLKDFRTIILDFKNVKNVGQAFVDELFGVFGLENPNVDFEIQEANDDVLFMIRRGLVDRRFPQNRVKFKKAEHN